MPKERQLHPTFPAYQRWVIEKLVGIFASDGTNVVPHIVMRWIDQNVDYLKQYGISYEEWRSSESRPQGVVKSLQGHAASAEQDGTPGEQSNRKA